MTRDEAISIARSGAPDASAYCDTASTLVDGLVALGMLKLDEPEDLAFRVLRDAGLPPTEANNFIDVLLKNGMKIVSK